ncbi:hypothetical protein ACTA71_001034 [Dictyostelium dimigraforme]
MLKQNECVLFFRLEDLRNYKNRDFLCGIGISGDYKILKNDIPDNGVLNSIVLYQGVILNHSFIPDTVKEIHYDPVYSNSMCFEDLPTSINTINNYNYKRNYNQRDPIITPSIKTLLFSKYQGKINNETIPNTVETVIIPNDWKNDYCDLEIGDFKHGLKRLNIMGYGNRFKPNILPDSLTHLKLSIFHDFNFKDENKCFLPKFLKTLQINSSTTITKGMLSNTILDLTLNIYNKDPIEKYSIPNSVKNFNIGGLSNLIISNGILPKSLEKLSIKNNGLTMIENDSFQFINHLTQLDLTDCSFDGHLFKNLLPQSLKKLKLSNNFNQPIDLNSFPNQLIELEFGKNFNHPILPFVLPSSLTFLKLSDSFNQPIFLNSFPINLKTLIFGYLDSKFNQIIQPNVLPHSITFLDFYCPNYTHIIDTPNILPSSLITFVRSNSIKHLISDDVLPITLKNIKF